MNIILDISAVLFIVALCVIVVSLIFGEKWCTPRAAGTLLVAAIWWPFSLLVYFITAMVCNEWWPSD